jgi:cytochrome c oxidase assembly protein subunit 15
MFLAVILLFGLLYLRKYCKDLEDVSIVPIRDEKALLLTRCLVFLTFTQVLMGTQVRQNVDHLMRDTMLATNENVIEKLNTMFYVHRTMSILVILMFLLLLFHFHRNRFSRDGFFLTMVGLISVLGNVVTGVTLNYFGFPASAQPPHLFFGIITLGILYSLSLNLRGTIIDE